MAKSRRERKFEGYHPRGSKVQHPEDAILFGVEKASRGEEMSQKAVDFYITRPKIKDQEVLTNGSELVALVLKDEGLAGLDVFIQQKIDYYTKNPDHCNGSMGFVRIFHTSKYYDRLMEYAKLQDLDRGWDIPTFDAMVHVTPDVYDVKGRRTLLLGV